SWTHLGWSGLAEPTLREQVARSGLALLFGLLLGEIVAKFFEEILAPGADLLVLDLGELAEQFLLAGRQVAGRLDDAPRQLVAPATAADVGHAPAPEPEDVAALAAARDLRAVAAVERRHVDFGAQGRLGEADRHLAVQIIAPPLEERMFLHQDL